ncbi:MAG: carboxymuconolactone decarboxylase family protein [Thermoanaerobaculia bacterium]
MMAEDLDRRTTELVGIAAAVAGHCQPCFDYHYATALEAGVTREEIQAAVKLARAVRAAGDRHMDEHVNQGMGEATTTMLADPNRRT